jgi:phosphatidylglycerol---prolipoprotein diacylglyceryl transferase
LPHWWRPSCLPAPFERLALRRDSAYSLVLLATIWGFVGAKIYYLLEQLPNFDVHHLGGMGFTWYGGLIGGALAALVIVHRHQLPLDTVAGAAAVPLTIAYGIGRLGCLLAGDGTYGKPTSVPWAMTFPNGVVPTTVPVHPTPLYEALDAVLIAAILWALGKSWNPAAVFGAYLALSGISRFLVDFLRINVPALLGLTQPQLWALVSLTVGAVLIARTQFLNPPRPIAAEAPGTGEAVTARSDDAVAARSSH